MNRGAFWLGFAAGLVLALGLALLLAPEVT